MKYGVLYKIYRLVLILFILIWCKDVTRESDVEVNHGFLRNVFFKLRMILSIRSEAIFFVSFSWCYFDYALVVDIEIGVWPPKGILRVGPFRVPLLNTLILLSSGVLITWTHSRVLRNDWYLRLITLIMTLLLGLHFSVIQYEEHSEVSYRFIIRGYGRIFFLATGSHGFHVMLGCFIILVSCVRLINLVIDEVRHYNFEFSAWHWHFVDVVWLFLFVLIYWWGF